MSDSCPLVYLLMWYLANNNRTIMARSMKSHCAVACLVTAYLGVEGRLRGAQ